MVDLFVSLSSGARLLLVSQDVKLAPHVLVPLLAREKVTVLQATPSFLHMCVQSALFHSATHTILTINVNILRTAQD